MVKCPHWGLDDKVSLLVVDKFLYDDVSGRVLFMMHVFCFALNEVLESSGLWPLRTDE